MAHGTSRVMNSVLQLASPGTRLGLLLALAALGGACGDGGEQARESSSDPDGREGASDPNDSDEARGSLCGECARWNPGGETTDFGSTAACGQAYLEREVDRAEAEELGFPLALFHELVEQPIDAPLTWAVQDTKGGGPARGYEPETRVRGAFEVRSFTYYSLDPERCDGTQCLLEDGTSTEQAGCDERLLLVNVSGELETLDGAVEVSFAKQPVSIRRPGQNDDIGVAAQANLRDVHGTLEFDPAVPEPRKGVLNLSLAFADDDEGAHGVIDFGIYPDWDNLPEERPDIPSDLSYYAPLEGHWDP